MSETSINREILLCSHCTEEDELDFDFTMAFQPIVNCATASIYGYEALVRGREIDKSAHSIISQVNDSNRYIFDQTCRIKAIALAAKLEMSSMLSMNFLPNAIYEPKRCLRTTLEAAKHYKFPPNKIMFEFTEVELIADSSHIKRIVDYYQAVGFTTATDDFGSGHSGLNLLADFQTDIVKVDMGLIRDVHSDRVRQSILTHCFNMFKDLNIIPLAEGVETQEEYNWLREAGVDLMQGYFFAKPSFESLPDVDMSIL